MIPNDSQIEADAQFLGFTEQDTARLLVHARRARTGSTARDGFKRSHGAANGSRPSGISDPTGEMATEDQELTPEVERQHEMLFDFLGQAASSKRAVRNTLDRLKGVQAYVKPIGQTSTPCKAEGCDGPAVARGWCDPCRKWIARNPSPDGLDPLTVPGHVIEERTKRRAKAS